jgi:hypothetical protein
VRTDGVSGGGHVGDPGGAADGSIAVSRTQRSSVRRGARAGRSVATSGVQASSAGSRAGRSPGDRLHIGGLGRPTHRQLGTEVLLEEVGAALALDLCALEQEAKASRSEGVSPNTARASQRCRASHSRSAFRTLITEWATSAQRKWGTFGQRRSFGFGRDVHLATPPRWCRFALPPANGCEPSGFHTALPPHPVVSLRSTTG